MNLPRALKRYGKWIDAVSDERGSDDGYWVYLVPGWQNSNDPGCHIIHEDSPAACAKAWLIEPCSCDDCEKLRG